MSLKNFLSIHFAGNFVWIKVYGNELLNNFFLCLLPRDSCYLELCEKKRNRHSQQQPNKWVFVYLRRVESLTFNVLFHDSLWEEEFLLVQTSEGTKNISFTPMLTKPVLRRMKETIFFVSHDLLEEIA